MPGIANGYPCFVISIGMIGLCTAVIGDVAGHLGCFIYLKDSVNAIAFVALGTSVPGTLKNCAFCPPLYVPQISEQDHHVTLFLLFTLLRQV